MERIICSFGNVLGEVLILINIELHFFVSAYYPLIYAMTNLQFRDPTG